MQRQRVRRVQELGDQELDGISELFGAGIDQPLAEGAVGEVHVPLLDSEEHLEKNHPDRPDIVLVVAHSPVLLEGRRVELGAHDAAGLEVGLGRVQIPDQQMVLRLHEEILALDVSVDDAHRVERPIAVDDLSEEVDGAGLWQAEVVLVGNVVLQRAEAAVGEHEVERVDRENHFPAAQHVRVVDLAEDVDFGEDGLFELVREVRVRRQAVPLSRENRLFFEIQHFEDLTELPVAQFP